MEIQELQHIIDIAGNYDIKDEYQRDEFLDNVHYPLTEAIRNNDTAIIDYLMKCVPEELFFISNTIMSETEDSEHPEMLKLYDKMLEDDEHIEKILGVLQVQLDEARVKDEYDDENYYVFNIRADMAEDIHLSPKQVELWKKIIEQQALIVNAHLMKKDESNM